VHNFSRRDCWALRRGREYVVDGRGVRCAHVRDPDASYVCMPLTAQGETFGVLHIRKGEEGSVDPATDEYRRLLGTVVDQVAMILVNLELRESHEDLHLQSIRDPVTDLFNRRYMEESLDRELKRASRAGQQLGLIMIDIDHFKQINDSHGHDVGDSVLSALGEFLKGRIRGEDIACRFGGEEFMLILPEATPEVTKQRALEIVADFKSIRINDGKGGVPTPTLSAGVATFPDDGTNRNAIIRAVDEMLYQAKEQGRDRVVAAHEAF
jgi:diguanylate cyclase (GGDEF)-like protein